MADPTSNNLFTCKHLRSKEMYYQADQRDGDQYSGGAYWCAKNHESFGPDGGVVERSECTPDRTCFQE